MRNSLQNNWPELFKNIKIMKNKERESVTRGDDKEILKGIVMWDTGLDHGIETRTLVEKLVKIGIKTSLINSTVSC